jgi:N-acetylneuraminic acid mutarotase
MLIPSRHNRVEGARVRKLLKRLLVLCWLIGPQLHAQTSTTPPMADRSSSASIGEQRVLRPLPAAPVARSNWAVARAGDQVFAFYGIGAGKTSGDIAKEIYALDLHAGRWRRVGDIPVTQGRLGSAAVTIAGEIYLIGGYSVSPKGEETSTPEVWRFNPGTGHMSIETTMPTPVDDTVALPWRDRWIVLVSGWHDTDNVVDVQIYDTQARRWTKGTSWPDKPVFGHAGGLVGDAMVVCDGVTATKGGDGKNHYAITNACWQGQLDPHAIGDIRWHQLSAHPGVPLYRAGATGAADCAGVPCIVFAGGTNRPYNYNGIGYDHEPAEPSAAVFGFDPEHGTWTNYAPAPVAGMDFRGLLSFNGSFALFGGMRAGQQVSDQVIQFNLEPVQGAH